MMEIIYQIMVYFVKGKIWRFKDFYNDRKLKGILKMNCFFCGKYFMSSLELKCYFSSPVI